MTFPLTADYNKFWEYPIRRCVRRARLRKFFHAIWCAIRGHKWLKVVGPTSGGTWMETCRRCGRIEEVETFDSSDDNLMYRLLSAAYHKHARFGGVYGSLNYEVQSTSSQVQKLHKTLDKIDKQLDSQLKRVKWTFPNRKDDGV